MLSLYDYDDALATNSKDAFANRKLFFIRYQRGDLFEKTWWHKEVKKDGEPEKKDANGKIKPWVYNHYVPHSRIIKAVEDNILEKTRGDAVKFLVDVIAQLKIEEDDEVKGVNPLANRLAYDAWAEWAISSIADWHGIMFYGPGTGDGAGTKLDKPTGTTKGAVQLARVTKSAVTLQGLLGGKLNLADVVPNESGTASATGKGTPVDPKIRALFALTMNDNNLPADDSDDSDYDPMDD